MNKCNNIYEAKKTSTYIYFPMNINHILKTSLRTESPFNQNCCMFTFFPKRTVPIKIETVFKKVFTKVLLKIH